MKYPEVNKWNYLDEDNIHILEVARRFKNFANSIDQKAIQKLKKDGENHKLEHHNSKVEKNIHWYGAKIYIIGFLDEYCMGGKRNLITKTPSLVTGMFMKLAETFHYTSDDYFYPRLYIYDMAADFVQYYEITRDAELNEDLIKEFFLFFNEYLINSTDDDKMKQEHTLIFRDSYISIEKDYLEENQKQYLYFAYGSNMDKIQMDHRCPGAVPLGITKKWNHKTILNTSGVATIIPLKGSISYGILWKVSEEHIKTLDVYEGIKKGIYKKINSSVMIEGYQYPSLVYIAKDDKVGMPKRMGYLDKLLRGINYFNGHSEWFNEIKKLGHLQNS